MKKTVLIVLTFAMIIGLGVYIDATVSQYQRAFGELAELAGAP